jgi:hypothetical protein
MTAEQRSVVINNWLLQHDDKAVIAKAKRGGLGVNGGGSVSVAFNISPEQTKRLEGLLDGRKFTLSSLVRNIFEESRT